MTGTALFDRAPTATPSDHRPSLTPDPELGPAGTSRHEVPSAPAGPPLTTAHRSPSEDRPAVRHPAGQFWL
jgi:hypothetical protein